MVRTSYAETHLLRYLEKLSDPDSCTVGLIVGQPLEDKDYILHFAKTPPTQTATNPKPLLSILDVLEITIGEHAKHTTRMLPGGMYVLGIFIVSAENILNNFSPKVKSILSYIHKRLAKNCLLYGNANTPNKLMLHFDSKSRTHNSAIINLESGKLSPSDFKFIDKSHSWCSVQCKFEINKSIPLKKDSMVLPIKEQILDVLTGINSTVMDAYFVFDGEIKDKNETINFQPRRKIDEKTDDKNNCNVLQALILLPTNGSSQHANSEVIETVGSLKIGGVIASVIWVQSKMTYQMVSTAICQDIVRSLTARLGMHFDSLTEGEGGFLNDNACVHEPPRRVFISIPNSEIMLSDYLFPGEGSQEAQSSFQDVLDISITNRLAVKDIEGQADLSKYYTELSEGSCEPSGLESAQDTNKMMYIIGGGIAILVLILSLLIHFFKA